MQDNANNKEGGGGASWFDDHNDGALFISRSHITITRIMRMCFLTYTLVEW